MKSYFSHIRFEKLVDLVEGQLSAEEQTRVLAHLATCSQCAAEKVWLEQVIGLMRTDSTEAAPAAAVDRARKLFQGRAQQGNKAAPKPRPRIFAILQVDNTLPPLALGFRSGQPETQQRLYSAGDFGLDLRLKPVGSNWIVSGQLLGESVGGKVTLQGETHHVTAGLNELSEFTLTAVPSGRYSLVLFLDDTEIEITTLELS